MSGMGHNSPVIDDSTATMMVHSIAIRAQQMRQGKPLREGGLGRCSDTRTAGELYRFAATRARGTVTASFEGFELS